MSRSQWNDPFLIKCCVASDQKYMIITLKHMGSLSSDHWKAVNHFNSEVYKLNHGRKITPQCCAGACFQSTTVAVVLLLLLHCHWVWKYSTCLCERFVFSCLVVLQQCVQVSSGVGDCEQAASNVYSLNYALHSRTQQQIICSQHFIGAFLHLF